MEDLKSLNSMIAKVTLGEEILGMGGRPRVTIGRGNRESSRLFTDAPGAIFLLKR